MIQGFHGLAVERQSSAVVAFLVVLYGPLRTFKPILVSLLCVGRRVHGRIANSSASVFYLERTEISHYVINKYEDFDVIIMQGVHSPVVLLTLAAVHLSLLSPLSASVMTSCSAGLASSFQLSLQLHLISLFCLAVYLPTHQKTDTCTCTQDTRFKK